MRARCPRCNLTFERIEGHWIGAIAINTILSFGLMLVAMIVGFIVLSPAEPFGPFTAIIAAIGLIAPIVFYPFSKTIWTAVDLVFRPLEPGEADWARLGPRSVSRRASRR